MSSLLTELLFWGFLAFTNLLVSILVYSLTSLDLLQTHLSLGSPLRSKSSLPFISSPPPPSQHLSTRKIYTGPSFPPAFIYFSLLSALLNLGSAFVRFNQIHTLDFSALSAFTFFTYLFVDLGQDSHSTPALPNARVILSLYDWVSFFVSLVFLLCAAYNLASARALLLREREKSSTIWNLGKSSSWSSRQRRGRSLWNWQSTAHKADKAHALDDENDFDSEYFIGGLVDSHVSNRSFSASIRSRSHGQTADNSLPPPPGQPPQMSKKGHQMTGNSDECGNSRRSVDKSA